MPTITELTWQYLTAAVNEIKSPNQFVRRLAFPEGQDITVPTETIELGVFTKGREIAPFVRKNSEAVFVQGHSQTFQSVEAPNIRIKMGFTPSPLLFGRQPGMTIYTPGIGYQLSAVQQHINRDLKIMADMLVNTEEYGASLALQGVITYENTEEEVFTITFPRTASHNVTLSTFWNDGTPANVNIHEDFYTAKKLIAADAGLGVTDVILGSEAATAFRTLAAKGNIPSLTDYRYIQTGNITFMEQFRDDGALFMGVLDGVRVWEYSRTATLHGVAKDMIRPKYAEFLAITPAAEWQVVYGAIPDFDAFEGQAAQTKRFSKSWREKDPSAQIALTQSRPLPIPRRPDASLSMKVVSG